jgi:hypothetical protein
MTYKEENLLTQDSAIKRLSEDFDYYSTVLSDFLIKSSVFL